MTLKEQTIADNYMIAEVSATGTVTTLRALLATANIATPTVPILEVRITPSADVVLTDINTGKTLTISADTEKRIPALGVIDHLQLTNVATVTIEFYY